MHKLKNLKHIFAIWGIILVLIFGMIRILGADFIIPITQFFTYREAPFQNLIYRHEWKPSTDKIAIIKIDDKSLNDLQSQSDQKVLSIQKSLYQELLTKLYSAGVLGVGLDIVFANKDPEEGQFAEFLKAHQNTIISFQYGQTPFSCVQDEDGIYESCSGIPRSVYKEASWGMINISKYADRRPLIVDISGSMYESWKSEKRLDTLSLSLYRTQNPNYSHIFESGISYLNPYFGNPGTYPSISFSDVLSMSKRDLVATFAGKYVFIGENGTLIHDEVVSPVSGTMMPGVETHAHMLDGFLQNRIPMATSPEVLYSIIVILAFLTVGIYFFMPHLFAPIIAGGIFIFTIWIGRFLYGKHDIVFDIFPVMLATSILSFPLTFIYRFFIVDREKRELQKNFGHYVDPHVVEQIAEKDEDIVLGGEHKDVTVLFSDIAGFTTISEKLEPTDLFSLMTSYLSNMTNILIEQGGTLDKYIGDAVMGFFGAPLTLPDHANRGCRTALLMRERLPVFNADIMKHGMEPIDFRVGMASGDVMVGNIGSQDRFNYTVLGDTVNLASRLEGTGKEYNVHIILSHGTRSQISDEFFVRELDTIAVKGKSEGVRIYELIGFTKDVTDRTLYENYEKALTLYREGNYHDAGEIWAHQKDIDPPSLVMMNRCISLIRGETHLENGVYHMTHK